MPRSPENVRTNVGAKALSRRTAIRSHDHPMRPQRTGRCETARAVMSQLDPEFGVNGAQVRIFLGELRGLDLDRAIEVWNAFAVAQQRGYAGALEAAQTVAAKQRTDAWLLARQAAAAIARERLGDPAVVGEVVDVLASVAGSIVIRDLLSRHDFRLLQLPWTWEGESTGLPLAAAAAAGLVTAPTAHAARAPWLLGGSAALPAAAGLAVAVVLGAVVFAGRPTSNVAVTDQSGAPTSGAQATFVFEPSPIGSSVTPASASPLESTASTPGEPPAEPPGPTAAPPPPAATAAPGATPGRTPKPTPRPPSQTPTPAPTPTPSRALCEVPSFLNLNTAHAQELWSGQGFTGTVTFSPDVPPQYKIASQSLAAGSSVTCASGITVSDKAP
jgi:hypothetical protein